MRRLLGLVVIVAAVRPAVAQPAPAAASAARQAEIRVELAWLADPLVCPYYPCARVAGGALEIGGHVPNEGIRVRVLEVARGQCGLPLVDRLHVRPGLRGPRLLVPADKLQRAALLTARAELPEYAGQMQVSCSPSGLLAVSGSAGSFEDRLRVSQGLRRLPGCAAVVNLLRVGPGRPAPTPPVVLGPRLLPGPEPAPPAGTGPGAQQATVAARTPLPELVPGLADAAPSIPYLSDSLVTLSPPQPQAEPTVKLVAEEVQLRLCQRIRQACPEADQVAVAFTAARTVRIHLRVRSQAEGERLTARVLALPEMASLNAAFEIQLQR